MSIMCADITTQATSWSPRKIGRCTITSCGCRPPPLCGSLARNTSPGAIVSPVALDGGAHRVDGGTEVELRSRPLPMMRPPSASSRVHRVVLRLGDDRADRGAARAPRRLPRRSASSRLRSTSSVDRVERVGRLLVVVSRTLDGADVDDERAVGVDASRGAAGHPDGRVGAVDQRGPARRVPGMRGRRRRARRPRHGRRRPRSTRTAPLAHAAAGGPVGDRRRRARRRSPALVRAADADGAQAHQLDRRAEHDRAARRSGGAYSSRKSSDELLDRRVVERVRR